MDHLLTKIPLWIQCYAGALLLIFIGAVIPMLREALGGGRELDSARSLIEEVPAPTPTERVNGRSLASIERLRQECRELPARSATWWGPVDESIERYDSPSGESGYFLLAPVRELVKQDDLVDLYYTASRWQVIPSLLTSLGLLGTFAALLAGLGGLSTNQATNVVQGVPHLIENLSGKFVTSVVALLLSVIFTCLDTFLCQRRVSAAARGVIKAIETVVPSLSPSRLLLDLQRQSVKQTVNLANISADVVDKFAYVFKADLGPMLSSGVSTSVANELQGELVPVLQRVGEVMQELGVSIARLESGKQESIVGQLKGLTDSLEASIRESLGEMGQKFQESLAASTKDEFGELASVVKGSATVLSDMTQSFASMEAALSTIVKEAHDSTSSQRQASVEQTERLNQLVEGLMVRLNSAASENFSQVGALLTRVVAELSAKVTGLSEQLVEAVKQSSSESQVVVQATLEQAGSWSSKTSAQLETVLKTLQAQSTEFERAGDALLQAQQLLEATLVQSSEGLRAMSTAAEHVKTYTTSLAGLQGRLEEQGKTQVQLAALSKESVAKLNDAAARHQEFLDAYKSLFAQYRGVFDGLDDRLSRTLTTILEKMAAYNRAVENNFQVIVASANNVVPNMAASLKDATDELREQLEELTDTLAKSNGKKS